MEDIEKLVDQIKNDVSEKSEEELFQFLLSQVGKDSEGYERAAEAFATLTHPKVGKLLQRMLEASRDKKLRKTIKRSLYRLKGRGVTVEETPPDRGHSVFQPPRPEQAQGLGSSIDLFGRRFLILAIPHPGQGLSVMHAIVDDTLGLVNFHGEGMSRKRFRSFLDEMEEEIPFPLVEMEPAYVALLLTQAYRSTLGKTATWSQDYLSLKSEIEAVQRDYERPPVYGVLDGEEIAGDDWRLKRSGELFNEYLLSSWFVKEESIQPYVDAIAEAEGSKIVLSNIQKEARRQEIYQKALAELFPEDRRLLYRRRMEEMAYVFFKLRKEEEAKMSLAVALDLGKPLNPFQPNLFLEQLVIRSISGVMTHAQEKKKEDDLSLIMKP